MRRISAAVLIAMAAVSCSAVVRWQKPGVSAAQQQRDETDCTGLANRETTVSTASTAGATSPSSTPYDPQRNRIQTLDTAVFDECMRARGYERVQTP